VGEYNINYPIKKSYAAFISNVPKSPRLNSLSPLEKSCQLDLSANAANQLNSLKKEPTGDIDFTKKMGRDKAKIMGGLSCNFYIFECKIRFFCPMKFPPIFQSCRKGFLNFIVFDSFTQKKLQKSPPK